MSATSDGFHGFPSLKTGIEIELRGEMRNQNVIRGSERTVRPQRIANAQFAEGSAAPRVHRAVLCEQERETIAAAELLNFERGREACDLSRSEEHFSVVSAALAFTTAATGADSVLAVDEDGEVGSHSDVCAVLEAQSGEIDERKRAHAAGAAAIVAPRVDVACLVQCERMRR